MGLRENLIRGGFWSNLDPIKPGGNLKQDLDPVQDFSRSEE